MSNSRDTSYGRILKTSAFLGGSSAIGVLLGIIRVKILAVHLGPAPYGTIGLYGSFLGIIGTIAGLGISYSAVREIAQASGRGNELEIGHSTVAVRRVVWATGLLGLLLTVALAWPASYWTFGSGEHAWAFVALSVTVLFTQLSGGQTALLQGLRRIREITAINIAGAALSTALAIPILLYLGERGIVPFMLAISAGTLTVSWFYARRVGTSGVVQTWVETWRRSKQMVRLGAVLIVTGLFAMVANYLVRLILQSQVGEIGVGLYHAAFTLSGTYVGFILAAMGTDYYPRLTQVAGDGSKVNQLVSEQTDMAVIMAVPGLVAAIALAEAIIWAFYSSRFGGATEVLRWTVLGLFFRIIAWPIGFILVARGDKRAFFCSETASWLMLVALTYVLVRRFGTVGAGIAFAGMYLFCALLVYAICRQRHGFRWHWSSVKLISVASLLIGGTFAASYINADTWRHAVSLLLAAAAVSFSAAALYRCFGRDRFLAGMTTVIRRLGLERGAKTPAAQTSTE